MLIVLPFEHLFSLFSKEYIGTIDIQDWDQDSQNVVRQLESLRIQQAHPRSLHKHVHWDRIYPFLSSICIGDTYTVYIRTTTFSVQEVEYLLRAVGLTVGPTGWIKGVKGSTDPLPSIDTMVIVTATTVSRYNQQQVIRTSVLMGHVPITQPDIQCILDLIWYPQLPEIVGHVTSAPSILSPKPHIAFVNEQSNPNNRVYLFVDTSPTGKQFDIFRCYLYGIIDFFSLYFPTVLLVPWDVESKPTIYTFTRGQSPWEVIDKLPQIEKRTVEYKDILTRFEQQVCKQLTHPANTCLFVLSIHKRKALPAGHETMDQIIRKYHIPVYNLWGAHFMSGKGIMKGFMDLLSIKSSWWQYVKKEQIGSYMYDCLNQSGSIYSTLEYKECHGVLSHSLQHCRSLCNNTLPIPVVCKYPHTRLEYNGQTLLCHKGDVNVETYMMYIFRQFYQQRYFPLLETIFSDHGFGDVPSKMDGTTKLYYTSTKENLEKIRSKYVLYKKSQIRKVFVGRIIHPVRDELISSFKQKVSTKEVLVTIWTTWVQVLMEHIQVYHLKAVMKNSYQPLEELERQYQALMHNPDEQRVIGSQIQLQRGSQYELYLLKKEIKKLSSTVSVRDQITLF